MQRTNSGIGPLNDNRRAFLRTFFFDNVEYPCAVEFDEFILIHWYNKHITKWDVWIYSKKEYMLSPIDSTTKLAKLEAVPIMAP